MNTKKKNIGTKTVYISILLLFMFYPNFVSAQSGNTLQFSNENRRRMSMSFEVVSNLIVIPLRINDSDSLFFILDTGLKTSIITELPEKTLKTMRLAGSTKIRGLGTEDDLEVHYSPGNRVKMGKIYSDNYDFFIIKDKQLDLSTEMGTTIHGIIGSDVFNAFIVRINYISRRIIFFNPEHFNPKGRYRFYQTLPITLYRHKPYIDLPIVTQENDSLTATLLVDNGASDAIWLFKESHEKIKVPPQNRYNYLGRGINGKIFGYQGRIKSLSVGKFTLNDVTASFPDTLALHNVPYVDIPGRNGSIGAELLVRFTHYIDYHNEVMAFRKNSNFRRPFRYNMLGLLVNAPIDGLPMFVVEGVRKDSPADIAGIQPEDILVSINGKPTVKMELDEIYSYMRNKDGKRISIKVDRNGEIIQFRTRLKEDL